MKKLSLKEILTEAQSEASKQAHALGFVYGGRAQWIDPKTREVKARSVKTASGTKLVRVGEEGGDEAEKKKGKLSIVDFDDTLLDATTEIKQDKRAIMYINMIKGLQQQGGDVIVMCGRGEEKKVAKCLRDQGISSGIKVAPVGHTDPNRKREFVKKKIRSGYKDIEYFDDSKKNIAAVESLRATFNRANIKLITHEIKAINPDLEQHFDKKTDRAP
jgi:hypothetical protein